jgi:large subunit ribosomal protein L3
MMVMKLFKIGFNEKKEKNISKPVLGQFRKNNLTPVSILKEFKFPNQSEMKIGDELKVDFFTVGEKLKSEEKVKVKVSRVL